MSEPDVQIYLPDAVDHACIFNYKDASRTVYWHYTAAQTIGISDL